MRISALKRKVCPFCRIVSGVFGAHFTNDTFSHSIALCFSVLFCASLNYSVNLCSFLHDIHILFVIQIICLFRARLRSSAVICSHTSVIEVLSKSLNTKYEKYNNNIHTRTASVKHHRNPFQLRQRLSFICSESLSASYFWVRKPINIELSRKWVTFTPSLSSPVYLPEFSITSGRAFL